MEQKAATPGARLAGMMKKIYSRGMTSTSGGNLSVKDGAGNIWITPSGVDKGTLRAEDVGYVSPGGEVSGPHKPSMELPFHRMIYESNGEIRAIVHAHPPALVTYSLLRRIPETEVLASLYHICGKRGIAGYALPGSRKLGEEICGILNRGSKAIMMANHALVIAASSLEEAFLIMETLEFCAALMIRARRLGTPVLLTPEQLEMGRRRPENYACLRLGAERLEKEGESLLALTRRGYDQGILSSSFGSFSLPVPGGFLITPPGADKLSLRREQLLFIPAGLEINLEEEILFHKALYEKGEGIGGIIISQPLNVMAFSVVRKDLDTAIIPESFMMLRTPRRGAYEDFFQAPGKLLDQLSLSSPALVVDSHAFIVVGRTLLKAFDALEVGELSAGSLIDTVHMGPSYSIPPGGIGELKEAFGLN